MLRKLLKEYFTFTRSERNGLIILLSLLLMLVAVRLSIPYLLSGSEPIPGKFEVELARFESGLVYYEREDDASGNAVINPFIFDPNTADEAELCSLGLDRFVVNNIIRYRKKGGRFRSSSDVKKIYGLKNEDFLILESFIRIEPGNIGQGHKGESTDNTLVEIDKHGPGRSPFYSEDTIDTDADHYSESVLYIPINQADSADLIRLPGIGPVLSGRIIRYRELLGGFCKKEQLLEVYRLTPETYDNLSGMVRIDTQHIDLINVNNLDVDSLPYHPYVTDYHFKAIISYRELVGRIELIEEINGNRLLPADVFEKIRFYLTAE